MPRTEKHKFKRLFLAADLHGSEIVFRKFLAAAKFYEADALLIGGDMTSKTIVPVVEGGGGGYSTRLAGESRENLSAGEIKAIQKSIEEFGEYSGWSLREEYKESRGEPPKGRKPFNL